MHRRAAEPAVLHARRSPCACGSWPATSPARPARPGRRVSERRPRFNEVLFIDARTLGHMMSRKNRELADTDIARIADTYHAWRGEDADLKPYEDVPGFCASVTLDTIREHQHVLTPGRYVGSEAVEDDGEPLDEKIARLTAEISDGFAKRSALQEKVLAALDTLAAADNVRVVLDHPARALGRVWWFDQDGAVRNSAQGGRVLRIRGARDLNR